MLVFVRSMDSTITLEDLTDIFQSIAINAEFVSYSLRVHLKLSNWGFFVGRFTSGMMIAAEL